MRADAGAASGCGWFGRFGGAAVFGGDALGFFELVFEDVMRQAASTGVPWSTSSRAGGDAQLVAG
jgi:hypothetical protein